jgi:hypothetical protein
MGLFNAKYSPGLCLCDAPLFDQTIDLQRQLSFEQFLLRVGQTKIGEDIPVVVPGMLQPCPLCETIGFLFSLHANLAFADVSIRPRPAVGESGLCLSSSLQSLASISFETHAKRKRLPRIGPCRQLSMYRRDGQRQFRVPIHRQSLATALPPDQSHPVARHKGHSQSRAGPRPGTLEGPCGSIRPKQSGARLFPLYINTSTGMSGSTAIGRILTDFPRLGTCTAKTSAYAPTACGLFASNCRSTYCRMPPLA